MGDPDRLAMEEGNLNKIKNLLSFDNFRIYRYTIYFSGEFNQDIIDLSKNSTLNYYPTYLNLVRENSGIIYLDFNIRSLDKWVFTTSVSRLSRGLLFVSGWYYFSSCNLKMDNWIDYINHERTDKKSVTDLLDSSEFRESSSRDQYAILMNIDNFKIGNS